MNLLLLLCDLPSQVDILPFFFVVVRFWLFGVASLLSPEICFIWGHWPYIKHQTDINCPTDRGDIRGPGHMQRAGSSVETAIHQCQHPRVLMQLLVCQPRYIGVPSQGGYTGINCKLKLLHCVNPGKELGCLFMAKVHC